MSKPIPKTKTYNNGEVTVVWKPTLCIHSEKCVKGLPEVFKPKSKPWIQVEGAGSEALVAQVRQCPSGALTILGDETEPEVALKMKVASGGPLLVQGTVKVIHPDGTEEERKNPALCRCGLSSNKPYCDGSHKASDFDS